MFGDRGFDVVANETDGADVITLDAGGAFTGLSEPVEEACRLALGYRVNPRFDGRLLVDGSHWPPPSRSR